MAVKGVDFTEVTSAPGEVRQRQADGDGPVECRDFNELRMHLLHDPADAGVNVNLNNLGAQ